MPIYFAFALCFAAAQGEHCVLRSWPHPIHPGHPLHSTCLRAAAAFGGYYVHTRWRAGTLICSYAPLPYPPTTSPIPPWRYG